MKKPFILLMILLLLLITAGAFAESLDYSDPAMWAYFNETENALADVFFIAPTNVSGSDTQLSADLNDADQKNAIQAGIGMQTGIYEQNTRFFSPYYRQITLACYTAAEEERQTYLAVAEQDVMDAFAWYMENENGGRPVIIAGFSQGAEIGLQLLKNYAEDEAFQDQLVAAYLIGWRVTADDLAECPALKMAQGETDTGVIISFECEAEDVTGTVIVPEGIFTYSINPLNWKTDSMPASKEENLGYVYPAADGSVKVEIPQLCGGYIDPVRGTIKVTDVSPEDYPSRIAFLPEGSYHIYDYEFYYRNLQKNVADRLNAYLEK